jgi:very-long-chain enoyl-CoA reductase
MKVTVTRGKKGDPITLNVDGKDSVGSLKSQFVNAKGSRDVNRVSFKHTDEKLKDKVKFDDDTSMLSSLQVRDGTELIFKDLGPQIGYRFVFYVEYLGPILMVGLFAFFRTQIFGLFGLNVKGGFDSMNSVAQLGVYCWIAHFMKRELETAFVHKFSRLTMPLKNIFINCGYYYSFAAIISYPLCAPSFVAPDEMQVNIGLTIFILSELANLHTHLNLASMRPAQLSKKREIPKGFGFDLVACPNYFFEIMAWVGFSIMTGIIWSYLFTAFGFYQMHEWAQKKHKGYKKTYGDEYTKLKRKAIIPFIV